jgi:MoaA/NifB/PqqE/SkfB family radical SAM enzyme
MWDAGARCGLLVDYIPIQESYDPDLVLTESDWVYKRTAVSARCAERRPMVVNFPEGEYKKGGCMSAGNGFLHIGANGDVEPCTFCHYATHNLRSSSYLDALDSPFFRSIRTTFARRPNPSGTCMLFEHEDEVAAIAETHGARRTTPEPLVVGG